MILGARGPGKWLHITQAITLVGAIVTLTGCASNEAGGSHATPANFSSQAGPGATPAALRYPGQATPFGGQTIGPHRGSPQPLSQLSGLTGPQLRATLGAPELLHRDGPAELWQYAGSGCVLQVYLYQDDGKYRVTYAEVHVNDPNVVSTATCVNWVPIARIQASAPNLTH